MYYQQQNKRYPQRWLLAHFEATLYFSIFFLFVANLLAYKHLWLCNYYYYGYVVIMAINTYGFVIMGKQIRYGEDWTCIKVHTVKGISNKCEMNFNRLTPRRTHVSPFTKISILF